ncbi:MAG: hypothetical protein LC650_00770 [Actinobacteria bacterium]|nr:hypothetical protein [Actinomycetota bacterium]
MFDYPTERTDTGATDEGWSDDGRNLVDEAAYEACKEWRSYLVERAAAAERLAAGGTV